MIWQTISRSRDSICGGTIWPDTHSMTLNVPTAKKMKRNENKREKERRKRNVSKKRKIFDQELIASGQVAHLGDACYEAAAVIMKQSPKLLAKVLGHQMAKQFGSDYLERPTPPCATAMQITTDLFFDGFREGMAVTMFLVLTGKLDLTMIETDKPVPLQETPPPEEPIC